MFLNFKITNYRSIGGEVVIDFSIKDSQKLGAFAEIGDQAVNNIACFIGPNASGKSNILKSIVHFIRCMYRSYSIPYYRYTEGFRTHFCREDLPAEFSTEFIDNEVRYKYEVSVLNGNVQKETLEKRNETTKRYNNIFKRTPESIVFGKTMKINEQDKNRLGDDMSLLSLLLELNYFRENEFLPIKRFYSNISPQAVSYIGNDPRYKAEHVSQILQDDNILFEELMDELKAVDTGISSLELKKNKVRTRKAGSNEFFERERATIETSHNVAEQDYRLSISEESDGTLRYMNVFTSLFNALRNGGMFFADELEQSLHPDLTARIINRFMDKNKNPNNAQLMFTTHNPWFLQDLTKTQIFITEKNDKAETEIFRLDEIAGVRNDENYFMKYIAGEYDGRPKIKEN